MALEVLILHHLVSLVTSFHPEAIQGPSHLLALSIQDISHHSRGSKGLMSCVPCTGKESSARARNAVVPMRAHSWASHLILCQGGGITEWENRNHSGETEERAR